jgi:exodeoxyribonuclease VII small subunit
MKDKPKTFKQTLERLEQIVHEIEQGKVELEESVQRYEEGTELIAHARAILASAEQKIQKLQAGSNDAPKLEPLDEEGREET